MPGSNTTWLAACLYIHLPFTNMFAFLPSLGLQLPSVYDYVGLNMASKSTSQACVEIPGHACGGAIPDSFSMGSGSEEKTSSVNTVKCNTCFRSATIYELMHKSCKMVQSVQTNNSQVHIDHPRSTEHMVMVFCPKHCWRIRNSRLGEHAVEQN